MKIHMCHRCARIQLILLDGNWYHMVPFVELLCFPKLNKALHKWWQCEPILVLLMWWMCIIARINNWWKFMLLVLSMNKCEYKLWYLMLVNNAAILLTDNLVIWQFSFWQQSSLKWLYGFVCCHILPEVKHEHDSRIFIFIITHWTWLSFVKVKWKPCRKFVYVEHILGFSQYLITLFLPTPTLKLCIIVCFETFFNVRHWVNILRFEKSASLQS